ncbi:hypothetical protein Y1Q_0006940 [Alligator mississippiensis]|uniref:Uncharacterized protein n=1 Tax=Alligator mississippiensis TaxID=8496 RepID=A0A151M171_ALLMI|nr:hypothetical protein Y1Q_0006940 [Alligator mississippiensis]
MRAEPSCEDRHASRLAFPSVTQESSCPGPGHAYHKGAALPKGKAPESRPLLKEKRIKFHLGSLNLELLLQSQGAQLPLLRHTCGSR